VVAFRAQQLRGAELTSPQRKYKDATYATTLIILLSARGHTAMCEQILSGMARADCGS
jgi:hypothetical protein